MQVSLKTYNNENLKGFLHYGFELRENSAIGL